MGDSHTRPGAEVLCLSRSQAKISSQTPAERLGKCAQGGQLGWKWNLQCSFKEKKKKALLLTGYFWVLGLLFFFSLLPICSLSSFNKLIPAAYSEQENTIYMKIKQINLVFSGKAFKHTKLLRLVVS